MNEYLLKRFNYFNKEKIETLPNTYTKEIETGVLTWQQNKYLGGIKSFILIAQNRKLCDGSIWRNNCNQHPHNYYLHIASELGLLEYFFYYNFFL